MGLGYEVLVVVDGLEVFELFDYVKMVLLDVVVFDVLMLWMDGF